MRGEKRVKKSTGIVKKINLDFTIFQYLCRGYWPAKISDKLKISKGVVSYHTTSLEERGLVRMRAQGVWDILQNYKKKELKKTTRVGSNQVGDNLNSFEEDSTRAHAYQFKLRLKENLKNWIKENREKVLRMKGIEFKELKHLFGGGQGIVFKGRKIHLTNKSIIIYEKASYFAPNSEQGNSSAMIDVLKLVKALERELGADFSIKGEYKIKVTRQHHSLIKNTLANIYNKSKGEKLEVSDSKGQWLLIDNSWNLDELECIHPKTGVPDSMGMQGWMNSMKKTNFEVTPEATLENFKETNERIKILSEQNLMMSQVMEQQQNNMIKIIKMNFKEK